jgi:hypothetical protein
MNNNITPNQDITGHNTGQIGDVLDTSLDTSIDTSADEAMKGFQPVRDAGFHTAEGLAATAVAVAVLLVLSSGLSQFATTVIARLNELIG